MKKIKRILSAMVAVFMLTTTVIPVSAATPPISPSTEVFVIAVTGLDGTAAVIKESKSYKKNTVFKITDARVTKEIGIGDVILVTKQVNRKTGKLSYKYMAGNSRFSLGFVKDANTVVDSTGKEFKFKNNFGAGKIVQIVYDSKFTYEIGDDTFKEAKLISNMAY